MKSSNPKIEVIKGTLIRDRWFIAPPKEDFNEKGNIVLIYEYSFGPCETFEYGFTKDGKPYVDYKWCEDEYFADDSYYEEIPLTELLKKIERIIDDISNTELSSWKAIYEKVVKRFYEDVEFPWAKITPHL